MEITTIGAIQDELKSRITNPEHALLTTEGILYDLSLDENGLLESDSEVSYCGITEESLGEYKQYDPSVPIASVREIPTLGTVGAANFITSFYMWYFQKPPKQDFLVLPKLLWNLVCNASLLAPYPVIIRVQQLVGDPNPDGIWGSATTQRIKDFFEGKTVAEIEEFGLKFTQAIEARYRELGENPKFEATAGAWIDRAYRKFNMMREYIVLQHSKQQIDSPVSETVQALSAAGSPTPQQVAQQPVAGSPTPQQVAQPTPQQVAQQPVAGSPTPQQVAQPTPQQVAQPTPQPAADPTQETKELLEKLGLAQPTPQQVPQPTPEIMQDYLQTMKDLTTALAEHNVLARELIALRQAELEYAKSLESETEADSDSGGSDDGGVLGMAKKAMNVAEVVTNPVGAAKDALNRLG